MTSAPAFDPPPFPPPLLSDQQLISLASQGHLPLTLAPDHVKLFSDLSRAAQSFFAAYTSAEKQSRFPPADGTQSGYHNIVGEKEYLSIRAHGHATTPQLPREEATDLAPSADADVLELLAAQVWSRTASLLHRVLVDLGRALGLPDPHTAWDTLLDGCLRLPADLEQATPTLLRVFNYLPNSGTADNHADLGLLTLCVGEAEGLQLLTPAAGGSTWEWVDAQGPTVLIGKTLKALAGNRVRLGMHRVVGNPKGRSSAIFALRASLRHAIDLSRFGGEGTLDSKKLWHDIANSSFNVNAAKDVRERQRANIHARREAGKMSEGFVLAPKVASSS